MINKDPIILSFSEQQFIEFLYGTKRAEDLMEEQDEQQFDYYRKVYRNWQNGKKYTWNWAPSPFNSLWMIYRGLFLFASFFIAILAIIRALIPNSDIIAASISFFIFGFFSNILLKNWLEYQLKKIPFENIPKGGFDTLCTMLVVMEIIKPALPLIEVIIHANDLSYILLFCKKASNTSIMAIFSITLLLLHFYYYHIKPRFKYKK